MNRFGWGFLLLLVLGVGLFALLVSKGGGGGESPAAPVVIPVPTPAQPPAIAPSGLAIPVTGVAPAALVDTWGDARSGGRVHDAIDIMAPRGTPVVAAMAGTVEKLFQSEAGGTTAYVRSNDGNWVAYYAHLDAYAAGLTEGRKLDRGDPIGTVGDTGNAPAGVTHLHFELHRMAPGEGWWQGAPINPYPLLAGNRAAR